jgi:hypothetical protein
MHQLISSAMIEVVCKSISKAGAARFYLGMPTNDEIQVMIPKMSQSPGSTVLRERTAEVGNIPRYLIGQQVFKQRRSIMNYAIDSIYNTGQELIAFLKKDRSNEGEKYIPWQTFYGDRHTPSAS